MHLSCNKKHSHDLSGYLHQDKLSPEGIARFVDTIYAYYRDNKRVFSWRYVDDPYEVVVSEIMLQQTQTDRVREKYALFIKEFPSLTSLANAPTSQVIATWQGLGYNRRALALQLFAQRVIADYGGTIPNNPEELQEFKGIGPATAASICAFAFNKPTVFIETNIRAVYIHCFFPDRGLVSDGQIMPLVAQTLDNQNPRSWYYALMDFGVMVKKMHKNPSRRSAHYAVQSKFEGSDRQVRGLILKMLVDVPVLSIDTFIDQIAREPEKIVRILGDLEKEGFIKRKGENYSLATG